MQHAALDGVARAAFRKIASDSVLHCHRHRREGASKAREKIGTPARPSQTRIESETAGWEGKAIRCSGGMESV